MYLQKTQENPSTGVALPPTDKISKDGASTDKKKATGRTVLYARVSTAEQTLAHQKAQAEAAGFHLDEVVADHGISGLSTTLADRPEGRRLFDMLRAGDTLVVRWVDRLGRNYRDVTDTIREFMRRGVVIRTVINGIRGSACLLASPLRVAGLCSVGMRFGLAGSFLLMAKWCFPIFRSD